MGRQAQANLAVVLVELRKFMEEKL